jgi:hypothetical protein
MDTIVITSQFVVEIMKQYPWFGLFAAVVSSASIISAATPTPKSGSFLAKAYAVIDVLALNIGKAKDK